LPLPVLEPQLFYHACRSLLIYPLSYRGSNIWYISPLPSGNPWSVDGCLAPRRFR
jgi:hypothetical protein